MAHEARLSLVSRPVVAGETIQEGRLVRLTASGVRDDLLVAMLAASGTRFNVYVAFAAPDDFARPTPSVMYTANKLGTFYESSAWGDFKETDTFYHAGLSTYENPILLSGYVALAKRGGIYHVPSGCVVDSADLKVPQNLVKVSDDGTGRWEYTASEANAIAKVVDYDAALAQYTFEFGEV